MADDKTLVRVPILDSLFVLCVLRENARRNFESPDTGGGDEGGTSDRLLSSRWAPGGNALHQASNVEDSLPCRLRTRKGGTRIDAPLSKRLLNAVRVHAGRQQKFADWTELGEDSQGRVRFFQWIAVKIEEAQRLAKPPKRLWHLVDKVQAEVKVLQRELE